MVKARHYLQGFLIGMLFEYLLRVGDSNYAKFTIGALVVGALFDVFKKK